MSGGMQGPQDTSFYAMKSAVQQSVNIIKADPGVQNVMGFTGGQGATNTRLHVHRPQAAGTSAR